MDVLIIIIKYNASYLDKDIDGYTAEYLCLVLSE